MPYVPVVFAVCLFIDLHRNQKPGAANLKQSVVSYSLTATSDCFDEKSSEVNFENISVLSEN